MNIEKYLILNKYLLSLFGVSEAKELFDKLRDVKEDFDTDDRSYFINTIRGFQNLKISENDLLKYDYNIKSYVKEISRNRGNINLKYFQYLAVLFTEIVLDNLKNKKDEFLSKLNEFLENYKNEHKITLIDSFTESDLQKLAFWMATGSGKTLIMHINYHQFLKYDLFSPSNIILITPNEGLSKQHYEELQKSGIPCRRYDGSSNSGFSNDNEVLVIEITKLVEEKKGGGVSIPVDAFEGKNLVFVDEGHKGKKSEEQKWVKLRNKLSGNGFVFEYSATFGQILSEKEPEILKEYAKSIIFDYSYKYFYLDGYGKDFSVINVSGNNISNFGEVIFVANLLSFYEQLLVYENNKEKAKKEYNIEKPLWIFVGTTVTTKNQNDMSDVVEIVNFIREALEDQNQNQNRSWLEAKIEYILKNQNIFGNKFHFIREIFIKNNSIDSIDYSRLVKDLYDKVFGGEGKLELSELKRAPGEIGLKVNGKYFGVINIGDVSGFKKELEKNGFSVNQDVITDSLFDEIKKTDSKINILIGSKKFIEGWDTWRVSSMGLLNIGKEQGPQIIQLFGRGVRLKGKDMSLKRSGKEDLKLLETLNIYSIKADYLNKFLEAISKEEVEYETIEIPVKPQYECKWKKLYILSENGKKFEEEKVLKLKEDDTIRCELDLLPRVSIYQSQDGETRNKVKVENVETDVSEVNFSEGIKGIIDLLDWQKIYLDIINFKVQKGYWNLIFDVETLKNLLPKCKVRSYSGIFNVNSIEDIKRIEDIAILALKKYIDLFYRKKAKEFETENLCYKEFKQLPLPFISNKEQGYIVQINKDNKGNIGKIKKMAEELKEYLYELKGKLSGNQKLEGLISNISNIETQLDTLKARLEENSKELFEQTNIEKIDFDRSLFVPLLVQSEGIDKISPPALVESEKKFVEDLRNYLQNNGNKLKGAKVYLLRNYPFSGVGFQLKWSAFYPDFIMWVIKENKQAIVFIDPKGLIHTKGLDDEKIQFSKEIKGIQDKLNQNIILESFIISSTKYKDLVKGFSNQPRKDDYIKNNVLFQEDDDYIDKLFGKILDVLNGNSATRV